MTSKLWEIHGYFFLVKGKILISEKNSIHHTPPMMFTYSFLFCMVKIDLRCNVGTDAKLM